MTTRMLLIVCLIVPSVNIVLPAPAARAGQTTKLISIQPVTPSPSRRVYFYDPSGDEGRLLRLQERLLDRGAYHVNVFLPFHVVCMLPDEVAENEFTQGGISAVEEREIGSGRPDGAGDRAAFLSECYGLARAIADPDEQLVRAMRESSGWTGIRDSVAVPDPFRYEDSGGGAALSDQEDNRRIFQDSEFMAGKIVVNLILPESRGYAEYWQNYEIDEAIKGSLAGILEYQEQFSYAPLNYIIRTYKRVPTNYEPAHTRFEFHESWIKDVMKSMGYVYYNYSAPRVVHEFHTIMRKYYDADWIFTAFIIQAQTIYNHQIVLTDFVGYSILGGPYCIIPFPAGEYGYAGGLSTMLALHMQHETGHIFWALDEAEGAKPRECTARSGYLNYINGSKIEKFILEYIPVNSCVGMPRPCIMEIPEWQGGWVCDYTAGQIGIVDANENSVPDVFDSYPIVEFEGGPAETLVVDTFTVRCSIRSVPVLNRNFRQDTTFWKHYASPLKDCVMDINGFGNLYLLAEDGRWDELEEEVVIPLSDLSVGLTSVELYIRNQAGCKSPARVKNIFRAGLSYTLYSIECGNDGIALSWYMVGETFDARFDLYRIDMSVEPNDTTLIVGDLKPSGEAEDQFLPFCFFDGNVEPFHTYGYYVRGTYELAIQGGEPREFVTDSKIFKGTAIIPVPEGELLSQAIPNPFRSSTHFSILIPTTMEGGAASGDRTSGGNAARTSGLPREVPTMLEVVVYDVMGRRVKTIVREERYGTAATLEWDGSNDSGESVPSGIYFLKVVAGGRSQVRKVAKMH